MIILYPYQAWLIFLLGLFFGFCLGFSESVFSVESVAQCAINAKLVFENQVLWDVIGFGLPCGVKP